MGPSNSALRPGTPEFDQLRAEAEVGLRRQGVTDGVRLHGGPMTGWYVRRDSDVFDAEWFWTWPPTVQQDFQPGQYKLSSSGKYAEWAIK